MTVAGARSHQLGLGGWVSLLSVRRAVPFYQAAAPKGIGMTSYADEIDDDEGLTYFEGLLDEGFRHD
jgi:hypothetical protein